jgi:hypothetical protein
VAATPLGGAARMPGATSAAAAIAAATEAVRREVKFIAGNDRKARSYHDAAASLRHPRLTSHSSFRILSRT